MDTVQHGMLVSLAFTAVGVVLLTCGFLLIDWLTPGRLRHQIWIERNRNAAVFLSSSLLGIAAIVFTAIVATNSGPWTGLARAAVFGALGLLLMAIAFRLVDLLTPGRLGEMMVDPQPNPAVWVNATINVAIAAIVSASII